MSKNWVFLILFAAVWFGCYAIGARAQTQKPTHQTRHWTIEGIRYAPIEVIDTTGVCIYRGTYSITAVPKTLLPPGTGYE